VANLSAFLKTHPVTHPGKADFQMNSLSIFRATRR
jgi:hypothetical protein